jgi:mRNA interferase YafQ
MKAIRRTTQFKKDVRRAQKRGKDFSGFKRIIELLVKGQPLEDHHRDHALTGQWKGPRDCHIEPDWLLIYRVTDDELILIRPGSHADIFGK